MRDGKGKRLIPNSRIKVLNPKGNVMLEADANVRIKFALQYGDVTVSIEDDHLFVCNSGMGDIRVAPKGSTAIFVGVPSIWDEEAK